MPKALKTCPKSNKSPNLVTLLSCQKILFGEKPTTFLYQNAKITFLIIFSPAEKCLQKWILSLQKNCPHIDTTFVRFYSKFSNKFICAETNNKKENISLKIESCCLTELHNNNKGPSCWDETKSNCLTDAALQL